MNNRRSERKLRGRFSLAATGVLVLAAVTAVQTGAAIDRGTTGAAAQSKILIGESSPVASNPNVHAVTYGGQLAAKRLHWRYKMLDANLSSDKQVADIDTFISLRVNGIITLTLDPGAADAVYKRARKAGIPIVGINTTSRYIETNIAEQTDTTCVPGHDAAKYIAARIPHAKVLVVGGPPVPSILLRSRCFVRAAKKAGLIVQQTQYNVKDAEATAQPIVQSMLARYPSTQAIFAYNDPSALGAAAVVRSSGKSAWSGNKKGIIIIGINGSADAVDAIKAGAMTATYDANSPAAGAAAIAALAIPLKSHKPLSAMPRTVVVKTKRWDSSNIASYVPPFKRRVKLPNLLK